MRPLTVRRLFGMHCTRAFEEYVRTCYSSVNSLESFHTLKVWQNNLSIDGFDRDDADVK